MQINAPSAVLKDIALSPQLKWRAVPSINFKWKCVLPKEKFMAEMFGICWYMVFEKNNIC